MTISYPVDPALRFVVWKISTSEILHRNRPWPRADGQPIVGGDPDIALLEMQETEVADYDPRYFSAVKTETPDLPDESFSIVWTTQKRAIADITTAVENRQNLELEKHVSAVEKDVILLLGLAVLFRKTNNLQLTNKEQELADKITEKATKVWRNNDRVHQLITQIEANQEPDLDAGWEPE